MKKVLLGLAISIGFAGSAFAGSQSGIYVGGTFGYASVATQPATGSVMANAGLSYGGILGYRINNYFSIEGNYQSLLSSATTKNSSTLDTRTVTSKGSVADLLWFPEGNQFYFKAGYNKISNQISGTRTTLITTLFNSYFVNSPYAESHDSSGMVIGFGNEYRSTDSRISFRSGLDYFALNSVSASEGAFNLYFGGIYNF